jgi:hypothetical protein
MNGGYPMQFDEGLPSPAPVQSRDMDSLSPLFAAAYPGGSAAITQRSIIYSSVLKALFQRAKLVDEFEYACSLLGFDGMKDAGWSPEAESTRVVTDLHRLASLPLQPHAQVRLLLFGYSHIAEMEFTYRLVMNMLRVVEGRRYSMVPFLDKNGRVIEKPSNKINMIKKASTSLDVGSVEELFDWYEPQLRNSFAHSTFHLYQDRYNIVRGRGFKADGVISTGLSIEKELMPRINGSLRFFEAFYESWRNARAAYRENVVVTGRLQSDESRIDVELLGDPINGLTGFRSPPQG